MRDFGRVATRPLIDVLFFLFLFSSNMQFSTKDRDNDVKSNYNCAMNFKGGWWYKGCHNANPNGLYQGGAYAQGITWLTFKGQDYSLKHMEIKIRPI